MSDHLGEFEQLILFALLQLEGEAYGVPIRHEIERRAKRDVSQGAVYTALGRLEERGFVSSRVAEKTPDRGGRRRKYYDLEPAGAKALHRVYSELKGMASGVVPRLAEMAEGAS